MVEARPVLMSTAVRVFYALAVATAAVTLVVGTILAVYESPRCCGDGVNSAPPRTVSEYERAQNRYERQMGTIISLIGVAIMGGSVAGLRATLNPLRCAGLAAGTVMLIVGAVFASMGSPDWLVGVWALLALVVLIGAGGWLEDGHPRFAVGS
jgi:hypothetical protein